MFSGSLSERSWAPLCSVRAWLFDEIPWIWVTAENINQFFGISDGMEFDSYSVRYTTDGRQKFLLCPARHIFIGQILRERAFGGRMLSKREACGCQLAPKWYQSRTQNDCHVTDVLLIGGRPKAAFIWLFWRMAGGQRPP